MSTKTTQLEVTRKRLKHGSTDQYAKRKGFIKSDTAHSVKASWGPANRV